MLQCLDVINEMGIYPEEMYACGGGAKSENWRQMLADLYNTQVVTLENEEGPALGVAILASVASGIYDSIPEACDKLIKTKNVQQPVAENTAAYEKFYNIYKGLYPALKDSFAALSE